MNRTTSRWLALLFLVAALLSAGWDVANWTGKVPRYRPDLMGGGRTLDVFQGGVESVILFTLALGAWFAALRTGFLVAVLFAGFAAQLSLTEPHWLSAVRLRPWEWRGSHDLVLLAVIGFEAVVAIALLRGRLLDFARRAGRALPLVGWLVLLLGTLAACTHYTLYVPSGKWTALVLQVGFGMAMVVVHGAMLLAIVSEPRKERLVDLAQRARGTLRRLDRPLPFLLSLAAFATAVLVNQVVLEGLYHIPDGAGYLFQARCLAAGELGLEAPPVERACELYLLTVQDGVWYGITNPGWPAFLAIGAFFGVPWIVNPVLGALTVLFAHGFVARISSRARAHAVAALLVASPWFLFLNASYMTHTLSLFLVALAWWAVMRSREGNAAFALLSGAAMGWLFLVRPLDGLLVGGFTGIAWLFATRTLDRRLLLYGSGCIAIAALILPYNAHFTGSPTSFPIQVYLDRIWYPGANRLGFGADVGNPPGGWGILDPYPGHGWRDVVLNTNQNLHSLQTELHGFAIGSLTFLLAFVGWGRKNALDRLSLALLVLLLVGYNAYWFSGGPDYGARYWYLVILPALYLTTRGIEILCERGDAGGVASFVRERWGFAVLVLVLGTGGVFTLWRATTKYSEYRGFHADYVRLARSEDLAGALVFLRSSEEGSYREVRAADPDPEYSSAFFASDFVHREGPIFLRDLGKEANDRAIQFWKPKKVRHAVVRRLRGDDRLPPAGDPVGWERARFLPELRDDGEE